ncbi:MAG: hypothetical protein LBQ73_02365 [Tannerellaceae bacterium]|jgi:hypothetical protein|nr:hypothetical protein [Tannerellaceae bacterium]
MKPLILTFFVVILVYSLFFQDNETKLEPVFKEKKTPFYDEAKRRQYADSIFFITYPITGVNTKKTQSPSGSALALYSFEAHK